MQAKRLYGNKFRYETALDTNEAMEVIHNLEKSSIPLTLVVCDWIMPGKSGEEFLRELHISHPETRKVMITAHADNERLNSLREEIGLSGYLLKPWDEQSFTSVLETAFQD